MRMRKLVVVTLGLVLVLSVSARANTVEASRFSVQTVSPGHVSITYTPYVAPISSPPGELVASGSFEPSLSPWVLFLNPGGQGSFSQDCGTAASGSCSARLVVTAGDGQHLNGVQMAQDNITLAPNQRYVASFWAKADSAHSVDVVVKQHDDPWGVYGDSGLLPISTSWAQYSFLFTAPATVTNSFVKFNVSNTTGSVWIDDVSISPTSGSPSPPAGTRDPHVWPFTSSSIWNMPIGSGAQYVQFHATSNASGGEKAASGIETGVNGSGAGMALDGNLMPLGYGYGVNLGADINHIVKASSTDPLRTVFQQLAWGAGRCNGTTLAQPFSGGPTPWQLRIPDSLVIPDATNGTPNASSALVQPDGSISSFATTARCTAGGNDFHGTPSWQFTPGVSTAALAADENIWSTGTYGGHGASGLSSYGGVLTAEDLAGSAPIHHALSMDINGAEYLYRNPSSGVGFVWPAAGQDAASWKPDFYNGYHGHYPALRMGSLLAIPPNVTEASLGLTDSAAIKIFHAMQDYGVYIVDDTGWSSVDVNATPEASNAVSAGLPGSSWGGSQPKYSQLGLVYGKLAVVGNNGPGSIGGGGSPRVPLAPPL